MDAPYIDPIIDQKHASWLTSREKFILSILNQVINEIILDK